LILDFFLKNNLLEVNMTDRFLMLIICSLSMIVCLGGCSKKITYGDPKGIETVTVEFGSTDLQKIVEEMTRSFLNSKVVTSGIGPIVTVQEVNNKTSEYIDTRMITDSIRTQLSQSSVVRFVVDEVAMQEAISEIERQQNSEYYDQDTATEKGRMVGAAYRLTGNVASIVKQNSDTKDVYYKINLQLWNVQNGLLEWSEETEIRKSRS
jgi:uncharacterized protein (TIGR02722 family)